MESMDARQKIVALIVGLSLMGVIIELVRQRRLKEEYAWLWVLAGAGMLVIGLHYPLLEWLTRVIGAGWTTSTLFFLGMVFLIALTLHFSVRISALETRVKNLTQHIALLEAETASTDGAGNSSDTGAGDPAARQGRSASPGQSS